MKSMGKTISSSYKSLSIYKMALPIFAQTLLNISAGYIDTAMISRIGDNAVGAIGNAGQLTGFLGLMFSIISGATATMTAQYIGAKKTSDDTLPRLYSLALTFNFTLSLFICAIIVIFAPALVALIRTPLEMRTDAVEYLRIVGCFMTAQSCAIVFSAIFNAHGKTFLGLIIFLSSTLVNIAGNYCFLFGPLKFLGLFTKGVAIATSFSAVTSVVIACVMFARVIKARFSLKLLRPFPFDLLKKMLKLGIPSSGEGIVYAIGQIVILAIINSMGAVATATKMYCNILMSINIVFSSSLADSCAIVTGQAVGAGDYDYAYHNVLKCLKSAMVASLVVAALNYFLAPVTLGFFTKNLEIIKIGQDALLVVIALEVGRCTNLVVIRSMRSAADVLFPAILGVASMWLISIGGTVIFGKLLGLGFIGAVIAMAADEILRGVVVFIRWLKGTWRGRSIVGKKGEE